MSQRTLTLRHLVDGVLADVTSAVLADPAATYGVKRTDTNAVIIAANTAMTHVSTGLYTFTDPLLDSLLPYTWYAKITNLDGTVEYDQFTAPIISAHYATWPMVQSLLGPFNADTDADINSDGNATTIAAQREQALTQGDNAVNLYFGYWEIAVPSPSDKYYYVIQDVAARVSAVADSRFRGQVNQQGKPVEQYQVYLDDAKKMLDMVRKVLRPGVLPGVFTFVPTADPSAATSSDENAGWWGWW